MTSMVVQHTNPLPAVLAFHMDAFLCSAVPLPSNSLFIALESNSGWVHARVWDTWNTLLAPGFVSAQFWPL